MLEKSQTTKEILKLILPLYLPALLFAFSSGLMVPILPLFAQTFSGTYALVGLVLSAEAIGMLIGDLPAGLLMNRIGQKAALIIGLALSGISTALLFFADQVLIVILLRMVSGLGVALFSVSRHYFLVEMTPSTSRGRLISLFGGFFRMGRLLGPIAGGLIGVALGIRSAFLLFGAACLLGLVIAVFYLPHFEIPRGQGEKHSASQLYLQMFKAKWKDLGTAGMGYLFMQIVRSGPTILIPLFAANYLDMGVDTIGIIISLSSALDMALFYPAGILMDRRGRKTAILLSNFFLCLGVICIPFSGSFVTLLLAGLLTGLGSGLGSGCMLTLGSDLAPKNGRSEFLGAWTLIGDVGNTSGPLLIGYFADILTLPATSFVVVGGGVVAFLIFYKLVPETLVLKLKTTRPAKPA